MKQIDADALFEVIEKSMAENPHKEKTQRAMHIHEHKYFLTLLTTFPTIQPEERTESHACVCISQQDAVELAMKYCSDDDGTVQCDGDIRELLDELEDLPPAQPEQKWIPCGETVDIPDHEIMACDRYGEFIIGYLDCKDEQWICESDNSVMYDPVAWCELPKPYKEGGADVQ